MRGYTRYRLLRPLTILWQRLQLHSPLFPHDLFDGSLWHLADAREA
jgi:hypothetical protein